MNEAHNCPKCGTQEWDRIVWNERMGVSPFDDYFQCWCGHEWSEQPATNPDSLNQQKAPA